MEFSHLPVLAREAVSSLEIAPDGIYVDGTLGGGGHSKLILEKLTAGRLIGIDQDPDALEFASHRLEQYKNFTACRGNFRNISDIVKGLGIEEVNGVLLDIGVSSPQLDNPERGFSYHKDAPLDMRMSRSGESAADIVNGYSETELSRIFFEYGEERFSRQIARAIVRARQQKPIETTFELSDIILASVPARSKRDGHPARRVFQAIRIQVNDELNALSEGLAQAFSVLKTGGILSVITFHSLEDRIVKNKFRELSTGCTCPKDFPVCVCGNKPKGELINRKGVKAGEKELAENPRSRSAVLRSIRKL